MADLSDVENALVTLATNTIYPTGTSNPSIAGVDVRIYAGWPIPANLDSDLAAGKINVSIFPTRMERKTTRFQNEWLQQTLNTPTITLTVANNTITVTGTVTTPQTCMVIVNNVHPGFAYAIQSSDTLSTIATNLAALIPSASSIGAVIAVSNAKLLVANISVPGTSIREVARQERVFMTTVWAPSVTLRYTIGAALKVSYDSTNNLVMPDLFSARLIYQSTNEIDDPEKALLYRRDLIYSVEYATTQTETDYTIADSYIGTLTV